MNKAKRVDCYLFAKTWLAFRNGRELTSHDLADLLEISIRTSYLWMRTLHEMRCIHIVAYNLDSMGREQTPVYSYGDGFDKPKRPPRTLEDRRRKYHEKKARLLEKKVCGSF